MENLLNIVLVHPEIPYNTGNISRLCVGALANLHIVHPAAFSLDSKLVKRAGLDHWDALQVSEYRNLDHFLEVHHGDRLILTTKRGSKRYTDFAFLPGDYILFGSETKGLPQKLLVREGCPHIFVPIPGPVRSINVSNAAAIIVYEALRQLRQAGVEYPDCNEVAAKSPTAFYFDLKGH